MRCTLAALTALLFVSPATAQVRDVPAADRRAAATADSSALARGWTALAQGRPQDAVAASESVLGGRPWDHAAFVLKVHALSAGDPLRALDAYEEWLVNRADDVSLLEPIAIATVQRIARGPDAQLATEARAELIRAGVVSPNERGAVEPDPKDYQHDAARARGGDPDAVARLSAAAMEISPGDRSELARALEQAGMAGVPALMRLAASRNPMTRANAMQSLGRMHADTARATLEAGSRDQDPFVRASATVALAKLGDPQALTRVQQMLESEAPDNRLMAADAWEGRDGPWVAVIMPLLQDNDGLIRIHAARLIAPIDPEAARRALAVAVADANPAVRAEAATVLRDVAPANPAALPVAELRRLLRDRDAAARLPAAAGLLAAIRNGAR